MNVRAILDAKNECLLSEPLGSTEIVTIVLADRSLLCFLRIKVYTPTVLDMDFINERLTSQSSQSEFKIEQQMIENVHLSDVIVVDHI